MSSKDLTFNLFSRDVTATAGLRRVAAAAETESKTVGRAFGRLPGMAALAVAGFAAVSVKMAADFQQASTRLVTDAGESAANLALVKQGMLDISSSTGTSAKDIAAGMYLVESAGFHGKAGLDVMKAAAEGAKIGMADQKTVADALTTTMTDFGPKAGSAADVMSKLTATVSTGKTNMEALAGSLHSVLPAASAAGLGLSETLGAIGTMTQEGISADQATQNLNHSILSLQSPSHIATLAMAGVGVSSLDVAKNLGKRGLAGTYDLLLDAMKHHSKAGLVVVNAFNSSRQASASMATELAHLPAPLRASATAFQQGHLTSKEWAATLKTYPATVANLGKQFATTVKHANGFSDALKSGSGPTRTAAAQLEKMLGGTTGLQVALHLTGDHMDTFVKNTKTISGATTEAGGHVRGWADTQKGFNVQLGIAIESFKNMGIGLGTFLLPGLTKVVQAFSGFARGLRDGNPAAVTLAVVVGSLVGALAAVYIAQKLFAAGALIAQGAMGIVKIATLAWRGAMLILKLEIVLGRAVLMGWLVATRLAAAAQAFFIDGLLKSGVAWAVSTAKTVASTAALVIQKGIMIAGTVVTWAAAAATTAFGVAVDIATGPIGLIILAIVALIAIIVFLATHWKEVCKVIQDVWGAVCKWWADTTHAFMLGLQIEWNFLRKIITTVLAAIGTFFRVWWETQILPVINFFVNGWKLATAAAGKVPGMIIGFFKGAGSWLLDAGRNVINGLINGIKGMIGAVTSTVSNVAGGVVGTFKNILGIHSPSTVFHNFGQNIGHGLVNGLLGTRNQIASASNRLADTVISMFEKRKGGISAAAEHAALGSIGSGTRTLLAEANRRASIIKQVAAAQKQLTKDLAAQKKASDSSVRDSIISSGDITKFAAPGDAIQGLQRLVGDTKRFGADLKTLVRKGIDSNTLKQLIGAGVTGGGLATADQLLANPTDLRQIVALQNQLAGAASTLGSWAGQAEYGATITKDRSRLAALKGQERVEGWKMQKSAATLVNRVAQETHLHVHVHGTYTGTKDDLAKTIAQVTRDSVKKGTLPKNWATV